MSIHIREAAASPEKRDVLSAGRGVRAVMEFLAPGKERELFSQALARGEDLLLEEVLEEPREEELAFSGMLPDTEVFRSRIRKEVPELTIELPLREVPSPGMYGAGAFLGGLGGWGAALLLGSGTRGAGLLGGALGAAGALWVVEKLRSSSRWRCVLAGLLGLGSLGELWSGLSPSLLGTLLQKKRFSPLRFLGLLLGVPLVLGCVPRTVVDRPRLEALLKVLFLQRAALFRSMVSAEYLGEMARQGGVSQKEVFSPERALDRLSPALYALALAEPDFLEDAAAEVLRAAREAGFEGIFPEKKAFSELPEVWSDDLGERYDTLGYLAPGDPVRVEQLPVIFQGSVTKRGLVRRDKRRLSS